jgi:hypothetical protein
MGDGDTNLQKERRKARETHAGRSTYLAPKYASNCTTAQTSSRAARCRASRPWVQDKHETPAQTGLISPTPPCKPLLGLKVIERDIEKSMASGVAGRSRERTDRERCEHATASASFICALPRSQRFLDRCSPPAVCSLSSVSQPWKPPPPPPK